VIAQSVTSLRYGDVKCGYLASAAEKLKIDVPACVLRVHDVPDSYSSVDQSNQAVSCTVKCRKTIMQNHEILRRYVTVGLCEYGDGRYS